MAPHRRPHRQASGQSTVTVTGYDRTVISEPDDSHITLISTLLHEEFSGSLRGTGVADHVRVVGPGGDDTFTGVERFTGTLDGRAGTFALTAQGGSVGGIVHGHWQVVPNSATGDLVGLRGHGVFTAEPNPSATGDNYGTATDCLTYWFED
ncbi:DUF3224 domain-containing protein [Actinopolymorpha rutila]|uniref:DUF3224 domain-containing protein n=1 Tax=Actinopolymorpha rutila TaxID=446787 RepID=A0A852ZGS2_9ACTN|nr:DUF3224 domain-containing protein [Actinopolymorpha rutila]NYH90862.1 hypothetical protein [Actinopolymorpha rutila]